jgi:hypothetical protein
VVPQEETVRPPSDLKNVASDVEEAAISNRIAVEDSPNIENITAQ